jgi:hypothetical protein
MRTVRRPGVPGGRPPGSAERLPRHDARRACGGRWTRTVRRPGVPGGRPPGSAERLPRHDARRACGGRWMRTVRRPGPCPATTSGVSPGGTAGGRPPVAVDLGNAQPAPAPRPGEQLPEPVIGHTARLSSLRLVQIPSLGVEPVRLGCNSDVPSLLQCGTILVGLCDTLVGAPRSGPCQRAQPLSMSDC